MPTNSGYADLIAEMESLATACDENEPLLPGVGPSLAQLRTALQDLKTLKGLQEQMEGARQEATQQLQQLAENGREVVRRVRGFVKSRLGTKSERLPQFGVAPIRQRRARVPAPNPPALDIPIPE
ncbi:MAG TPA: hypothetical protein VNM67_06650 [Thermoanaerobaculia bacterium]|jgi:hypothetical protein|nr:hypothetical protein [Thermoanaerobaculia bacterium]